MPTIQRQDQSGRNRCGTITVLKKPDDRVRPITFKGQQFLNIVVLLVVLGLSVAILVGTPSVGLFVGLRFAPRRQIAVFYD